MRQGFDLFCFLSLALRMVPGIKLVHKYLLNEQINTLFGEYGQYGYIIEIIQCLDFLNEIILFEGA